MREGVRVRGVVRVDQDVARRELGRVLQDGGFQLAELLEDERALLAAGELMVGWLVGEKGRERKAERREDLPALGPPST